MEASNQQLEMHIRVKRNKTVLFLYVDPSETIRDVKNKIEALLGQPVAKQRLQKGVKLFEGEGSKLADLGIEYDDELLLTYQLEGSDLKFRDKGEEKAFLETHCTIPVHGLYLRISYSLGSDAWETPEPELLNDKSQPALKAA